MNKISKHKKGILLAILGIAGVVAIIFGKTVAVQGGVAGICWGIALVMVAYSSNERSEREIKELDKTAKYMMLDIQEKGVESDYYTVFDIDALNKAKYKVLKKQKKQFMGCIGFGVVLIILAFVCIV